MLSPSFSVIITILYHEKYRAIYKSCSGKSFLPVVLAVKGEDRHWRAGKEFAPSRLQALLLLPTPLPRAPRSAVVSYPCFPFSLQYRRGGGKGVWNWTGNTMLKNEDTEQQQELQQQAEQHRDKSSSKELLLVGGGGTAAVPAGSSGDGGKEMDFQHVFIAKNIWLCYCGETF